MTELENSERLLIEARRRGDPDGLAEALVKHADVLVRHFRFGAARDVLDEASAIHGQRGRAYDEARCTLFAASTCRLSGQLDEAEARTALAERAAQPGSGLARDAAVERGEIALARRDAPGAAEAFTRALDAATAPPLSPRARAGLLRKRATALVAGGRHADAARDLDAAHELFAQSTDPAEALRARVEQATALQAGGDAEASEHVERETRREAEAAGALGVLADLDLLAAARAVARNDPDAALEAARSARRRALDAVAPVAYLSASLTISDLCAARGDRSAAYESLAVGWATLADLLGADAAREAFAPALQALRASWGDAEFTRVKADYEARRRAASL